ncbi:serine hydrolase domain-containing protein [Novosphingobium sp.]|uniref:serine hydrolase domain-containing protein n=1 Tax=Novosphingobium sp. TaxID=1874826 RepID=UPI00286D90AB|nr:serine hydrolase domain-containing protein [Novosphingobium sp.]
MRRLMLAPIALLSCAAHAEPSAEEIYLERFATYLKDAGNFPYAPMERLPGAGNYRPLPVATHPAIALASLEQARGYAVANRSTAYLVWHDGKIEDAWFAPGINARTPLVSKSLSKPLTAIAVGRAIQLGKITSLDQPLSEILPELRGKQKGRILVRHLLDMRSGMLDQGFSTDPDHPLNRCYLSTEHGSCIIDTYPMIAEPGTRYAYANAPSDMVALVIERATGRRYGEFIANEVVRKIGALGGDIWVDRPGGLAHSGCCTLMPAETWLRLAVLLIDDGKWNGKRLLPANFVATMRKGTSQNPSFGLGIWIGEPFRQRRGFGAPGAAGPQVLHSQPYLDPDMFLFDGNNNQTVHISPKNRIIVLRMGPNPPASPEWDNSVLPNLLIRGLAGGGQGKP